MITEGAYEVQKVLDNRLTTCKQESWPMYYLHYKYTDKRIPWNIINYIGHVVNKKLTRKILQSYRKEEYELFDKNSYTYYW